MKKPEEQRIEHIIHRMLSDRSEDAPAGAVQYAKNLYRTRAVEPMPSMIQRVLAVMQADLAPGKAAFGERSAGGAQARQMLFEAGEHAVDLRITAGDNGFEIRGQIFGDGFENGDIQIAGEKALVTGKIDLVSGFKLSDVPAGSYAITISGKDTEIVIESFDLK